MLKFRKSLCLALVVGLLTSASFCGCQSSNAVSSSAAVGSSAGSSAISSANDKPAETVTLSYYYSLAGVTTDLHLVQDEMNKILKDKLNVQINLYQIDPGQYVKKMQVMLSAQEDFDLCFTADWKLPYTSNAAKGAFADLTELLPKYAPQTWALFSKDIWQAVRINGKIYASINNQLFARQTGFALKKSLVDKYNFDYKSVKTLADLGKFMALVKAGEPESETGNLLGYKMVNAKGFSYLFYNWGWENIGDASAPGAVKSLESKPVVFNEYDTDEFRTFIETCRDFAAKGYIPSNTLTAATVDMKKYACGEMASYSPGSAVSTKNSYFGEDAYAVGVGDPLITTSNVAITLTAVSATSKHPTEAVKFIEALNTDTTLFHLLSNGIEGKHYTVNADGTIKLPSEQIYREGNDWMYGNTWNKLIVEGNPLDLVEQEKKFNSTAKISTLMGFNFDSSAVTTEIANCTAVTTEYLPSFSTGLFGDQTNAEYQKFLSKLKDAGLEKILKEKQTQVDAYLASNK